MIESMSLIIFDINMRVYDDHEIGDFSIFKRTSFKNALVIEIRFRTFDVYLFDQSWNYDGKKYRKDIINGAFNYIYFNWFKLWNYTLPIMYIFKPISFTISSYTHSIFSKRDLSSLNHRWTIFHKEVIWWFQFIVINREICSYLRHLRNLRISCIIFFLMSN